MRKVCVLKHGPRGDVAPADYWTPEVEILQMSHAPYLLGSTVQTNVAIFQVIRHSRKSDIFIGEIAKTSFKVEFWVEIVTGS
jgi:hypothetical protein